MILSNLPYDVIPLLYKDLLLTEINSLSVTSREHYEYIQKDSGVQEIKRQKFNSLFGIVAKCEADTPVNTLANRIVNLCFLNLTSDRFASLTFDTQGIPSISLSSPANKPSESSSMPDFKEFNKEGIPSLVEADYNKEIQHYEAMIPHLDSFLKNYTQVFEELLDKTWEQAHSIHEYGNRHIRIKYMLKEIENLGLALASTFPEFTKIKMYGGKNLYDPHDYVGQQIRALRKKPTIKHFLDMAFELKSMADVKAYFCIGRVCQKVLGTATIEVNGQTMPIKIVGTACEDKTTVHVEFLDENQERLIGMSCERMWYKDLKKLDDNCQFNGKIVKELFIKSDIKGHALWIYLDCMEVEQDKETGDKPMMRLLVQVAVEILNREPARRLLIPHHRADDIVALLGLGSTNHWFNVDRKELLEFRTNSHRLLSNREPEGIQVWMDKLEFSDEHQTRYFKILDDEKGLEPAFVEYDLKETVTWEEQIRRKPMLNNFSGPLF